MPSSSSTRSITEPANSRPIDVHSDVSQVEPRSWTTILSFAAAVGLCIGLASPPVAWAAPTEQELEEATSLLKTDPEKAAALARHGIEQLREDQRQGLWDARHKEKLANDALLWQKKDLEERVATQSPADQELANKYITDTLPEVKAKNGAQVWLDVEENNKRLETLKGKLLNVAKEADYAIGKAKEEQHDAMTTALQMAEEEKKQGDIEASQITDPEMRGAVRQANREILRQKKRQADPNFKKADDAANRVARLMPGYTPH